jgi:hypothetical protein
MSAEHINSCVGTTKAGYPHWVQVGGFDVQQPRSVFGIIDVVVVLLWAACGTSVGCIEDGRSAVYCCWYYALNGCDAVFAVCCA